MATPITFTLYNADGTRNAAATPTYAGGYFGTRPGVTRTPPTIVNLGAGKFCITPTNTDETIGCASLIVTGCYPSHIASAITTFNKPFAVVAFFTGAGALISSGTPTIPTGAYQQFDGTALTPQTPNGITAALWSLTPLDAEVAAGGINWIMQAPASSFPAFYDGDLIAGATPSSLIVPVISNFSPAVGSLVEPGAALAFDVTVADGTALVDVSADFLFAGLTTEDGAFNGGVFTALYDVISTRTPITNGYRFSFKRRGGWVNSPSLRIVAVSASGVATSPVLYSWLISGNGVLPTSSTEAAAHALPIGRDHQFDHKTGKFVLVAGKNPLTTGLDSIRQAVTIKLLTFLGEYFLDPTVGVAYMQEIFKKQPNASAIKDEFKTQILSVAGILSVTSIETIFDPRVRALTVDFTADTDFGELSNSVPFPII